MSGSLLFEVTQTETCFHSSYCTGHYWCSVGMVYMVLEPNPGVLPIVLLQKHISVIRRSVETRGPTTYLEEKAVKTKHNAALIVYNLNSEQSLALHGSTCHKAQRQGFMLMQKKHPPPPPVWQFFLLSGAGNTQEL